MTAKIAIKIIALNCSSECETLAMRGSNVQPQTFPMMKMSTGSFGSGLMLGDEIKQVPVEISRLGPG